MKEKRKWQPREQLMLSEWLAKEYPQYEYRMRVRLGTYPIERDEAGRYLPDAEMRMLGVWRRWADAIVFLPDRLVLVEAAIRPSPGKLAQLELYKELIPHTPELAEFRDFPIEMVLVYAIEDPVLIKLAREKNIRCVHYIPKWLPAYLEILYPRERRAPSPAGFPLES
jgi:hypothetical protein